MTDSKEIPSIVRQVSLDTVERIDMALGGDWSPTVHTIWTREHGTLGFAARSHPINKPSLELYFTDSWVGIHCFTRTAGQNVFDEELASRIIEYVESQI